MLEENKSVLVTGCSSGIGKRIAYFLKEQDWKVYPTALTVSDVKVLREEGFEAILLDLSSSSSIDAAIDELLKLSSGSLTAIVNNAGFFQIGAIEDLSRKNIREQFEVNVFGPLELTSKILPLFRRQKSGKVVFIGSVNDSFVFPFTGAYCASKYALDVFSSALRKELFDSGIHVSIVCPGYFKTNILCNAIKLFYETVDSGKSIHNTAYKKFIRLIGERTNSIIQDETSCVAQAVHKILTSNNPGSKMVVPLRSKLNYMIRKFLPECIQDFLLYVKMKYGSNRDFD